MHARVPKSAWSGAGALIMDHLFRPSLFKQYSAGGLNHSEWAAQIGLRIRCAGNGVKMVLHVTAGPGPRLMGAAQHRDIAKIRIPAGKVNELRMEEERLHGSCPKD